MRWPAFIWSNNTFRPRGLSNAECRRTSPPASTKGKKQAWSGQLAVGIYKDNTIGRVRNLLWSASERIK